MIARRMTSVLLVLAAALAACGEEAQTRDCGALRFYRLPAGAPGYTDPFIGVQQFRVVAENVRTGEQQETVVPAAAAAGAAGSAETPTIPEGREVVYTLEGWGLAAGDPEIKVLARGRSCTLDLSQCRQPLDVPIFFAKAESFAPVYTPGPAAADGSLTLLGPQAFATGRFGATVTELADGKVIIAGGATLKTDASDVFAAAAIDTITNEIVVFDPQRNALFTDTSGVLALQRPRALHQAVPLSDGRVAFIGGYTSEGGQIVPTNTIDILDPLSSGVGPGPELQIARAQFTATLMPYRDDEVLIVGGQGQGVQNPQVGAAMSWERWSPTLGVVNGGMLETQRFNHTATAVDLGTKASSLVIVAGGENATGVVDSFEPFQAGSGEPLSMPAALRRMPARTLHTATWAAGQGYLYFIGGFTGADHAQATNRVDLLEIRAPAPSNQNQGKIAFVPDASAQVLNLAHPRAGHATIELPRNTILIAGGCESATAASCGSAGVGGAVLADEVIFQFEQDGRPTVTRGETRDSDPVWPRFGHALARLCNGMVLIVGGASRVDNALSPVTQLELFNPAD